MRTKGWYNRPGVTILEGKWQDFVETKLLEDGGFDIVYTDTFSEDYARAFLPRNHTCCSPSSHRGVSVRIVQVLPACAKSHALLNVAVQLLPRSRGYQYVLQARARNDLDQCWTADASFYDVYTRVSELHLEDVGLQVAWSEVPVTNQETMWGDTRKYFSLPFYRLPVATWP